MREFRLLLKQVSAGESLSYSCIHRLLCRRQRWELLVILVTGDDLQVIVNCRALPALLNLLASQRERAFVRKLVGPSPISYKRLSMRILFRHSSTSYRLRISRLVMGACWAISNATSGDVNRLDIIKYLVNESCIKPLWDLLVCPDNEIVQVAWESSQNRWGK